MKNQLCLFLLLIFASKLSAQEDNLFTPVHNLCKPGVIGKSPSKGILLEYGLFPGINLNTDDSDANQVSKYGRLRVKLKAPIIHKDGMNFLVGFNHYRERINFSNIGAMQTNLFKNLDDRVLKSSEISLYLSKSLNHKFYLSFKLGVALNGDYDKLLSFDQRYANYRFGAILGIKNGPDREVGVGVFGRKGFRNNNILPFFMYNRTFSRKWGLEMVLPVNIKARYTINRKNILLLGTEFSSRDYSIDIIDYSTGASNAVVNHMRRSEVSASVELMHRFGKWFWWSVKSGYVYHFDTEFTNPLNDAINNVSPRSSPFIKVGIFVSPPRK